MGDDRQPGPAGGGDRTGDGVARRSLEKGAAQFIGVEGCQLGARQRLLRRLRRRRRRRGPDLALHAPRPQDPARWSCSTSRKAKSTSTNPTRSTVSPARGVLICEDGNGEDEAGGDNYLRILSPAGELETFARNRHSPYLHRWEENKPGVIGRSEWSGLHLLPHGKWLFVHIQYPGRTFAITGPWEKGWA